MKLGDLLLAKRYINKKQLAHALEVQAESAIKDKLTPIGELLIQLNYVNLNDVTEALNDQKEETVMPTEIGENSKFTFDLKFLITIGAVIVSACATYFTMNASISELKSSNSPNRLEHDYLKDEVDNIKAMGDLKIISYKLDEYDEMFAELKTLVQQLAPLSTDLEYIKAELNKLKDKEIIIPEVDLSGIEDTLDKLDRDVSSLSSSLEAFESRLKKLERKKTGGRF